MTQTGVPTTNPLRTRLQRRDGTLIGGILTFPSPRLVEFLGLAGFDWVMLDGEHDGISAETTYTLAAAARSVGLITVARVPVNREEVLLQYADAGVDGLIAPHIRSAEEAREFVDAMWFPPNGTRGMATGSRAARYGLALAGTDYVAADQLRPVPIAMLEDVDAYDQLDEIAKVPGFEAAWLGAGDLSASLGVPAQVNHPDVVSRVSSALTELHSQGAAVVMSAADVTTAKAAADQGADLIAIPVGKLLASAAGELVRAVRG